MRDPRPSLIDHNLHSDSAVHPLRNASGGRGRAREAAQAALVRADKEDSTLLFTMFKRLEKLRLGHRLTLVVLLFAVPFSVLTLWLIMSGFNVQIATARNEERGSRYLHALTGFENALGGYYLHVTGGRAGDATALRRDVDNALTELERRHAETAHELNVTFAELDAKKQGDLDPAKFRARWSKLPDSIEAMDGITELLRCSSDLRNLINNNSTLVLDPEFKTYYAADLAVTGLPRWQAHFYADHPPILRKGVLPPPAQGMLMTEVSVLHDTIFQQISDDLDQVFASNPGTDFSDPACRAQLEQAAKNFQAAAKPFHDLLSEIASGSPDATYEALGKVSVPVEHGARELREAAYAALDHLLATREAGFARNRAYALITLAGFLTFATFFTWRIARGLNRQLRQLCLNLTENSEALEGLAQGVSSSSKTLAEGSNESAASLEEISLKTAIETDPGDRARRVSYSFLCRRPTEAGGIGLEPAAPVGPAP